MLLRPPGLHIKISPQGWTAQLTVSFALSLSQSTYRTKPKCLTQEAPGSPPAVLASSQAALHGGIVLPQSLPPPGLRMKGPEAPTQGSTWLHGEVCIFGGLFLSDTDLCPVCISHLGSYIKMQIPGPRAFASVGQASGPASAPDSECQAVCGKGLAIPASHSSCISELPWPQRAPAPGVTLPGEAPIESDIVFT